MNGSLPDIMFWGVICSLVVTLCAVWVVGWMDVRKAEDYTERCRLWARRHIKQ